MPCKENAALQASCSNNNNVNRDAGGGNVGVATVMSCSPKGSGFNRPSSSSMEPSTSPTAPSAAAQDCSETRHREMDALVNEIKLNLRLGLMPQSVGAGASCLGLRAPLVPRAPDANAGGKVTPTQLRQQRHAPYYVPSPRSDRPAHCPSCKSSLCARLSHRCASLRHGTCSAGAVENGGGDLDSPYRLLQELLKEGGLIKEAVRRLDQIKLPDEAGQELAGVSEPGPRRDYDYERDDYEERASVLHGLEAFI